MMSSTTSFSAAELAVIGGDLSKLTAEQRGIYYQRVCESLGLNPLTQPFQYIVLNGKLTLYATRTCTDQLRKLHGVSVHIISRERLEDLYIVTARAVMPDNRTDEAIGVVNLEGLRGEALANTLMKCETKAKRRVTLSICGLGWLDESEMDMIPEAHPVASNDALPAPPGVKLTGTGISPAPPGAKLTGTGVKILAKNWMVELRKLIADCPHYASEDGRPNIPHILNAIARLKYPTVTDENIGRVMEALRQRAADKEDEIRLGLPATQDELLSVADAPRG